MNELTREELQYINDYIFKGAACIRMDKHDIIETKIKYMIDNYHSHEWVKVHTNPNIHDWGDDTYYKCITCGLKNE